jgi:hypothetical protein
MSVTALELRRRLLERYLLKDGWITMAEVTPPKCSRRFDMVAIQGWGSRGHQAMGFELKISRSDWLRELAEPAKAEPLVSLVTGWWIVAPPGIVKENELPPSWGLLVVHPEQIRTGKQAPQLEPAPWSDAVWRCMLLRCATREASTASELEEARAEGNAKRQQERDAKELADLQEVVKKAQAATGVKLTSWTDYPALGAAMKALQGDATLAYALDREATALEKLAANMRATLAAVKPKADA